MPGLASDSYDDVVSPTTTTTPHNNGSSSSSNKTISASNAHGPVLNSVHRMASMFSSMQRNQQRSHRTMSSSPMMAVSTNCGHGDESDPSQRHQETSSSSIGSYGATTSSAANERNSRPATRSRSTETSRGGCSTTTITANNNNVSCCGDLKILDNKSKFTSAKAVFESLERQSSQHQKPRSSSSHTSTTTSQTRSSRMFNDQKTTSNRISSPSPGRNIKTSTTSCGSSPSVASSTANNYTSSPINVKQHSQQQRPRLMADREREEWPSNVNFNYLNDIPHKIIHGPPPPVPPKPKIDVLQHSPVAVSSSTTTTTIGIGASASSGLNYAFRSCTYEPKYVSSTFNSTSGNVKDLGSTSATSSKLLAATTSSSSSSKEFNDSVTSVEQINDISSNLSTTRALISSSKQITEGVRSSVVASTTTNSSCINGVSVGNSSSPTNNSLFYGHQSKDNTRNVLGATNNNSASKFLNSYAGCISPSSSMTTSNVRKYPRLTETLNMENNSNCNSKSSSTDGSVVTLIGSPKPSVRTQYGVASSSMNSPKTDVVYSSSSSTNNNNNVDSFCSTKLINEKSNASSGVVDCKMYTNETNSPSSSTAAYEPYWRQTGWYSRRYNVVNSSEQSTTTNVEGIAMRNYALRRNDDNNATRDSSSKLPIRGGGEMASSSVGDKTNSESPRLILNLFDNNNEKINVGGVCSSNVVDSSTSVVRNKDSSFVDYMTPAEASVLLSPATREEVLMHDNGERPPIAVGSTPPSSGGDVKSLPSLISIPQDVDLKRLSVCSNESTTINEHGSSTKADRYPMHDVSDVNWLTDGHFWIEIPGLADEIVVNPSPNPSPHGSFRYKKPTKVTFSVKPIRVYSTHSCLDYDRRNDDVDPVSASAEYELERRLDKMDVFDVDVDKGNEGLGFSIIGMGVGADAGLEKLGIFVKSITAGGAVYRDGRIRVCDQIVDVDGKNLVGVSQSYAASVLRGTSGTVKFKIGREKDLDASEIAQLIRQSLEQDRLSMSRENEILSRRGLNASSDVQEMKESKQLLPPPRPAGWGPVRDSPLQSTDSVFTHEDETPEQLVDNPHIEHLMTQLRKQTNVVELSSIDELNERNDDLISAPFVGANFVKAFQTDSPSSLGVNDSTQASLSTDINRLLNESLSDDKETHFPSNGAEPRTIASMLLQSSTTSSSSTMIASSSSSSTSRQRRSPPQQDVEMNLENEFINRRIGSLEHNLLEIKSEADKYQNLLLESQDQYVDLEKKYAKAKKLIRDYQEREKDLIEREEAHLRHLREKDQQYSSLLKNLNEKVGELEKQLTEAHRKRASLAERASINGSNAVLPITDISPALAYLPSKKLENEQLFRTSDPSTSTLNDHKTTIKIVSNNVVDDNAIDFGVPDTSVLDSSFAKSKAEAVKQSVIMSARQLPSRHVDDEFFEVCQRRVKNSSDAASTSSTTATTTLTTLSTTTTTTVKMSPTKISNATTSSGSPLTPRRLTQVLWMRKKATNASKDLEVSVMRGCGDFDKIPEVFQWNCDDVCKFLKTLGLEKYSPEFSINRVDGCKLMQLDGAKLKSMGIQNHTDRALIKKRVKDMKGQIDKERKIIGKEYKKLLKMEKDKKKT